jgi:N-acetylglucosamine kinase-like BadF-type ATPase
MPGVLAYAFLMRYVLGFDGGGTKTDCVLMDETGAILARGRAGPSNPSRVPLDSAYEAVLEAADKALAAAGKSRTDVASLCGAIAGAGLATALPEFHRRLQIDFPKCTIVLNTDLSMALAATEESPSLVVIAGTGSAVIGREAFGTLASEGGLGPVLGDPGSAYDIGRKAMIVSLSRQRPGENSHLGNEILEAFQCNWIELQSRIRGNPDAVLPKIFPIVAKAANEGDESARLLLRSAAEELAGFVERVVERLHLRNEGFFLAKTGGVFNRSAFLDDYFDELVRKIAPKTRIGFLPRPVAEFAARCAINCLDSPVRKVGS